MSAYYRPEDNDKALSSDEPYVGRTYLPSNPAWHFRDDYLVTQTREYHGIVVNEEGGCMIIRIAEDNDERFYNGRKVYFLIVPAVDVPGKWRRIGVEESPRDSTRVWTESGSCEWREFEI
jgi:hypothetical protein